MKQFFSIVGVIVLIMCVLLFVVSFDGGKISEVIGGSDTTDTDKPTDSTDSTDPSTPVESYTVSFDGSEHGSGSMNSVTVENGEYVTLPECGFTPSVGYMFSSWKLSHADSTYLPGSAYTPDRDVTFVAVWEAIPDAVDCIVESGYYRVLAEPQYLIGDSANQIDHQISFISNGTTFSSMRSEVADGIIYYGSMIVYRGHETAWEDENYRYITVNTDQTVSQDLYEWWHAYVQPIEEIIVAITDKTFTGAPTTAPTQYVGTGTGVFYLNTDLKTSNGLVVTTDGSTYIGDRIVWLTQDSELPSFDLYHDDTRVTSINPSNCTFTVKGTVYVTGVFNKVLTDHFTITDYVPEDSGDEGGVSGGNGGSTTTYTEVSGLYICKGDNNVFTTPNFEEQTVIGTYFEDGRGSYNFGRLAYDSGDNYLVFYDLNDEYLGYIALTAEREAYASGSFTFNDTQTVSAAFGQWLLENYEES